MRAVVLAGAGLVCAGLACSGPSPSLDGGRRDAGVEDAAVDAAPPPAPEPARGFCPEGYAPGCVAGFALCDEDGSCPEGQVCSSNGICYLEMDEPPEECWQAHGDRVSWSPGCASGRACLVRGASNRGICVTAALCDDLPDRWACRFYDGSLYDDSGWSGECPPSYPDNPYCGGVCGEVQCPEDPVWSLWSSERRFRTICVGTTATRPFGVCVAPVTGWGEAYDSYYGDRTVVHMELAELPEAYFVVPLVVCLDYQSRVEGVECVDLEGNPL